MIGILRFSILNYAIKYFWITENNELCKRNEFILIFLIFRVVLHNIHLYMRCVQRTETIISYNLQSS